MMQPPPNGVPPQMASPPPTYEQQQQQQNQYHQYQQQQWMMANQQQQQIQQQQPPPPYQYQPQQQMYYQQPPQAAAAQQQYSAAPAQPVGADEVRRLWIGDPQYWMDEQYLINRFAHTVEMASAKVIRNKQTGQSEGYGFIDFVSHAAAERTLQAYNGTVMPNTEQNYRLNWASHGGGEKRSDGTPDFTIFVGDLAPDVTDHVLQETFRSHYTSVKGAKIVTDMMTGRTKGYGFVRFGDESEQVRAMNEMNGKFCSTRPMRIGPANKKNTASYQNTRGTQSEDDPNNTTIFVGGLNDSVSDDQLRQVFSQYGVLLHVKIPEGKRCGFVQFADRNCAEEALRMLNGTQLGGQNIRLSWGRSPPNKQLQQDPNQLNGGYYGYARGQGTYGYAAAAQDPNRYCAGYPGYGNYQQPQQQAVTSPNLDYTHFISFPLATHPELVDKLLNFQKSTLGTSNANENENENLDRDSDGGTSEEQDKGQGLDTRSNVAVKLNVEGDNEHVKVDNTNIHRVSYPTRASKPSDLGIEKSIFINPKTFHLTVLMLKLWNKDRVDTAAEVLQNVSSKVLKALGSRPVSVRLKGLECMRGTLAKACVVYIPVEEIGGKGRLSRACQVILDAFVEAGLVLEKHGQEKLKLHATVMNARYRKGTRKLDSFDARGIFKQFGSEEWGEYLICEAHLSQRFVYDENGYYHRCASFPFPKLSNWIDFFSFEDSTANSTCSRNKVRVIFGSLVMIIVVFFNLYAESCS